MDTQQPLSMDSLSRRPRFKAQWVVPHRPKFAGFKAQKSVATFRYRTPITALLGAQNFIGGKDGLAFTFTPDEGLIALRDDPTPVLDKAKTHRLSAEKNSQFFQPKSNKK